MSTAMNTPIIVPATMKELWFREALNETAYGKETPIAMRTKGWDTNRFYLIGSSPEWYKPPITTKKDKRQQDAWYEVDKVDLTAKDLDIDGMADYTRFYISIESQDVNPLFGTGKWPKPRIFTKSSTFPKIDPKLKKSRKGKAATNRGKKADKEEKIIAPDSDSEDDANLPLSLSDATQPSDQQTTATPNTNADGKADQEPSEGVIEHAYTSEEEAELKNFFVAAKCLKEAKERGRHHVESREGRGIGSVRDTDE
jgi:hypothetical protein